MDIFNLAKNVVKVKKSVEEVYIRVVGIIMKEMDKAKYGIKMVLIIKVNGLRI